MILPENIQNTMNDKKLRESDGMSSAILPTNVTKDGEKRDSNKTNQSEQITQGIIMENKKKYKNKKGSTLRKLSENEKNMAEYQNQREGHMSIVSDGNSSNQNNVTNQNQTQNEGIMSERKLIDSNNNNNHKNETYHDTNLIRNIQNQSGTVCFKFFTLLFFLLFVGFF